MYFSLEPPSRDYHQRNEGGKQVDEACGSGATLATIIYYHMGNITQYLKKTIAQFRPSHCTLLMPPNDGPGSFGGLCSKARGYQHTQPLSVGKYCNANIRKSVLVLFPFLSS